MKIKILLIFCLLLASVAFSQTDEQSSIEGFWSLFKEAVINKDVTALEPLCRMPILQRYYDVNPFQYNSISEYFFLDIQESSLYIEQLKKIKIPQKFKFYDASIASEYCTSFNLPAETEFYHIILNDFYFSESTLFFVKIDGKYYFIGDDSFEYEG